MKTYLFYFIFFLASFLIAQKAPHIKFKEPKHDLGYIQKGDIDTLYFKFKNDGGSPLIFKDYKVECKCTTVHFPKNPVMPGLDSVVTVIFNSKGWTGYQDRKVIIISNANNTEETLHFKCTVINNKKLGF